MRARAQVVEDCPSEMDADIASASGQTVSALLTPQLLRHMQSPTPGARRHAVAVLNHMASYMTDSFNPHLDTYIQGLFALAHDASADVRRVVCIGLVQLLTLRPDKVAPVIGDLIKYMMARFVCRRRRQQRGPQRCARVQPPPASRPSSIYGAAALSSPLARALNCPFNPCSSLSNLSIFQNPP